MPKEKTNSNIRVLMLMKDSMIGGVASCVSSLSYGLKKYKGIDTIIGTSNGESVGGMLKEYVNIIDFGSKNIFTIIKNYKDIKTLIKKNNVNVIHAQNRIPAFYAAFYCFFHKNVKYIWSNHLVPLPSDFIHRTLTLYGSCAVAEGIEGKRMLIEDFHINQNKVEAVNLGVDFDSFKKSSISDQIGLKTKYEIKPDEKIILLYGRLAPVKGHDFLLDSLASLSDKSFRLVFPGENDEYKKHIIEKAETIGIANKIIFPGYIDGSQWLSIADLMVLPSKQEGFGIENVESFVMGVPVIRTKTAGYEDMKDLCFGVDYGDIHGLELLLKDFFDGNDKFKKIQEYAKNNCQRFSLKAYTEGYYNIYDRVINK